MNQDSYEVIKWLSAHKGGAGVDASTRLVFMPPSHHASIDYRSNPNRGSDVQNPTAVTTLMDDWERRLGDIAQKLHGKITNVRGAWNDNAYAKLVTSHHVAIDVHKKTASGTYNDSNLFRMSPMLASGMRVVSEHCIQADEDALAGLVDFAHRSEMPAKVLAYLEEAKNESARQSASDAIAAAFASRFNMTKMLGVEFKRLGLLDDLNATGVDEDGLPFAHVPTSTAGTPSVAPSSAREGLPYPPPAKEESNLLSGLLIT